MSAIIIVISVLGVAIGVAALVATMAVMDGADKLLSAKISSLEAHIRVTHLTGNEIIPTQSLMDSIKKAPDVLRAEPVLTREVLLMEADSEGRWLAEGARLIGASQLEDGNIYRIPLEATLTLNPGEALLGDELLERLGAEVGEDLMAITPNAGARPVSMPLKIVGTFSANFYEFDSTVAFVNEDTMRHAFGIAEGADYLHLDVRDPLHADAVALRLASELPLQYRFESWQKANGPFFEGIKWQKRMLFVILLLIILVAAFNIIGTLILMVIEKTRQIGILKAIGATRGMILRIFLIDGILIGLMGTLLGVAFGLGICAILPTIDFGISEEIYNFSRLPVAVDPWSVAAVVAASILICTISALLPALQAGSLEPVEALRHD